MGREFPTKVGERIEAMGIVEATLILTVAALYLSIVTGRIGANQLVSFSHFCDTLTGGMMPPANDF